MLKNKNILAVVISVLIAALLTALQISQGIQASPDSSWYLLLANLMSESFTIERIALFPPLYQWSLGVLGFVTASAKHAIYLYWFCGFALMLICYYVLAKRVMLIVIGAMLLLASLATISLFRYVWSEFGYAVLLVAVITCLYQFIKTKSGLWQSLFLLALALLPLQRYIGAYPAFYLGLIYLATACSRKQGVHYMLQLGFSALPIALVILWNYQISGTFSGERNMSQMGVYDNAIMAWWVIREHFLPAWAFWLLGLLLAFLMLNRKQTLSKSDAVIIGLYCLPMVQLLAQVFSSSWLAFDLMGPRFFIVVVPAFFALWLILFDYFQLSVRYFVTAMVLLVMLNVNGSDWQTYPLLSKKPASLEQNIKHFLSKQPAGKNVAFFIRDRKELLASWVLLQSITPNNYCLRYQVKSLGANAGFRYIANCDAGKGHQYTSVLSGDDLSRFDIVFLFKTAMPKNKWQQNFKGVEQFAIGEGRYFYLLEKNNKPLL